MSPPRKGKGLWLGTGWKLSPIFSIQTIHKPPKSSGSLCDVHAHLVRVTAFPSLPVRVRTASQVSWLHRPAPGRQPRAPPPAAGAPLHTTVCWPSARERETSEFVLNQFKTFQ